MDQLTATESGILEKGELPEDEILPWVNSDDFVSNTDEELVESLKEQVSESGEPSSSAQDSGVVSEKTFGPEATVAPTSGTIENKEMNSSEEDSVVPELPEDEL